jgi:hypothetical protein
MLFQKGNFMALTDAERKREWDRNYAEQSRCRELVRRRQEAAQKGSGGDFVSAVKAVMADKKIPYSQAAAIVNKQNPNLYQGARK